MNEAAKSEIQGTRGDKRFFLDHLEEIKAAKAIENAVKKVLSEGKVRSHDLGGDSSTIEVGDEVVIKIGENQAS